MTLPNECIIANQTSMTAKVIRNLPTYWRDLIERRVPRGTACTILPRHPPLTQKSFSNLVVLVWRTPLLDSMGIKSPGHAL